MVLQTKLANAAGRNSRSKQMGLMGQQEGKTCLYVAVAKSTYLYYTVRHIGLSTLLWQAVKVILTQDGIAVCRRHLPDSALPVMKCGGKMQQESSCSLVNSDLQDSQSL